ncbi:MAG: ATP-dependent RNA helicase HrpA, partial [Phycisphaerales bacterium]|nr:ATP-dependent RNA helicase HrpA [Phycisphaerales bacterium]
RIASCMTQDQRRLTQRLLGIQRATSGGGRGRAGPPMDDAIVRLERDIERSQGRRARRAASAPRPVFPPELPISERRQEIIEAISKHQVVIVCGETGSGKSTQLPKICLMAGRGVAGMIGHTQPRRIAARSVSARLAEELGVRVGDSVGFKVRFGDQTTPNTLIKVMTDGILLAEVQSDPLLEQYDTIIIDEAHERSLNIDFILGYLRQLLPKRPDLKLIITSATIDPERFSKHFGDAPIILVSGRTYPVELRYREISAQDEDELEDTMEHAIVSAVAELAGETDGDILVFLASEREIRETIELLEEAGWGKHAEILPLLARLSAAEQMRVFQRGAKRRIVLATNIAETSITVPGIRGVIDCGFARISRYSPKTKVQRLPIEAISRASAQQRAGRCGRIGPGVCIRLYSEIDFNARPEFTQPEIQRTNLASVLLQMKALRLGDPATFPFVEPPEERMIADAYETLRQLQAVDDAGELTPMGVLMARLPVEPSVARIILAARENELLAAAARRRPQGGPAPRVNGRGSGGALDRAGAIGLPASAERETRAMVGALEEVLIIVAAMSVIDPRERPLAEQQKADALHRRFRDELSDFVSLLKLWWYYKDQSARLSSSRLRKLCRSEYLSFVRLREWEDVHRQLIEMISELPGGSVGLSGAGRGSSGGGGSGGSGSDPRREEQRRHARRDQLLPRATQRRELHAGSMGGAPIPGTSREEKPSNVPISPLYEAIHRAMLTGLIASVGKRGKESGGFEYDGARAVKFAIFPGSGLFKANPDWVVAGELVRTTKLYARNIARVKPEWIEQAGEHLLKRAHSEPHYDERSSRVMAYERVSLLGLVIAEKRRVHFGTIDPKLSREIFIHHALVEGLLPTRGEFMGHNQSLVHEARQLQHKLRRVDVLADTSRRFAFFDDRVPADIHSGPAFEKWRVPAERDNPRLLFMTRSDVVALPEDTDLDALYPDMIELGHHTAPLRYSYAPGTDDDGVTAVVSIDDLPGLDNRPGQWLVPGMLVEKVEVLIRSLPKRLRAAFSPV